MNRREPWLVDQVRKRILLISRHDYWPGITPASIWELDADLWPQLALACDEIHEKRSQEADELRSRLRR